jgi:hypothetical protein
MAPPAVRLKYNPVMRPSSALPLAALVFVALQAAVACSIAPVDLTAVGGLPVDPSPTSSPPATSSTGNPIGCYYSWATRELPELTKRLQADLASYDPAIRAGAYAFGEDCRHEDGTVAFLPMETDFRVRIPVRNLSDEGMLGDWISRVMLVIHALPPEGLSGPRPGRVEFEFYVDDTESLRLLVEISRYWAEAGDLEGAALLQQFRPKP